MSLRDQLLKKGLVDKKRAQQIDREAKAERKANQGQRERKNVVQAREAADREAALKAAAEARAVARKQAELARDAAERPARVRQKILANRIRGRGPVPFHVPAPDARTVLRIDVHPNVAWKLRAGELAVAALGWPGPDLELVVINAEAALELRDIDPAVVCFLNTDTSGLAAPDLAFGEPVAQVDLRARRATHADIARLGAG
jgi:uncharacterized protein YaiL (DUF2058 family)